MNVTPRLGNAHRQVFAVDLVALGVGSWLICRAATDLPAMSIAMAGLIGIRTIMAGWLVRREGGRVVDELLVFLICMLIGAFNDWNTVVRHGIYRYAVPVYWPQWSTIPVWMLAYWGIILRAMAGLFIVVAGETSDRVQWGRWRRDHAGARLGIQLGLVAVARQAIVAWWWHPILSWAVPLIALVVRIVVVPPTRRELLALGVLLAVGPAVESLYILVAGLHVYALGWLGGVPLWIVVWWALGGSTWGELAVRGLSRTRRPNSATTTLRATSASRATPAV